MHKLGTTLKNTVLSFVMVIVLSAFVPISAYAEITTSPDTTTSTTPTVQAVETPPVPTAVSSSPPQVPPAQGATSNGATQNGQSAPNGAASNTFVYNESTGLWENDHYKWDPATRKTTPKSEQTYSYNPTTKKWDTKDWQYNPTTAQYEPNSYATATLPADAVIVPSTNSIVKPETSTSAHPTVSGSTFDNFYNASISNNNSTNALTGNANIDGNTRAGSARTGNALAMSNLFNLLQSSTNFLGNGAGVKTFNADIQGNVVGDILINPGTVNGLKANSGSTPIGNLTVNNQANGAINNNLAVSAASGGANISNNTTAGNATTGSANAVANVMNLLNSAITAGQSFMGAINIYGNLNGDIIFPPGFLDSLIASNSPNNAAIAAAPNLNGNNTTTANINSNQSINNKIASNATTGNATLANNTAAGNATTGNANSNVTILNLTGREIVGKNNLLVFVNVLGKWYGMIMDAPAGTTAASLGGGIAQNTNSGGCSTCNTNLKDTSNLAINNNIGVSAASGDATIANNTTAGNATTGNATTSVNIGNFINSNVSLSDWFGVLFINVFGSWNGSFGVNTSAGDIVSDPTPAPTSTESQASSASKTDSLPSTKKVFGFAPKLAAAPQNTSNNGTPEYVSGAEPAIEQSSADSSTVLGDTNAGSNGPTSSSVPARGIPAWILPFAGSFIAAVLLGAEQLVTRTQGRRKAALAVLQAAQVKTTAL